VNTLTELNEVNGVKILINGQENKEFKGGKFNFKDTFTRNK
ncbi:MAG: GerMN domain-containing protein, partial [Clostridiales bacterium]